MYTMGVGKDDSSKPSCMYSTTFGNRLTANTTAVNDGNWHYVCCVFSHNDWLDIYVDGNKEGRRDTNDDGGDLNEKEYISLGSSTTTAGLKWRWYGGLDDYMVWNRTLTSTEISEIYNNGSLSLGPIEEESTVVTIHNPLNSSYWTANDTLVKFRAVSENNATFNISAVLDGSIIYTNSSYINNTNISFYYNLSGGYHNLTVNATDTSYNTSSSRFFTINEYEIQSNDITSDTNVFEGDNHRFTIPIRYNPDLIASSISTLFWNGTNKGNTTSNGDNGTHFSNMKAITIGNATYNDSITFLFQNYITYDNGTVRIANSSAVAQTVYEIFIGNCTTPAWINTTALKFYIYYAANRSVYNATLDVDLDVWSLNTSFVKDYSFSYGNAASHNLCIYPAWANFTLDMLAESDFDGFAKRTYYLNDTNVDNTTESINLYLLDDGDAEALLIYVKDTSNRLQEDIYVSMLRYYPSVGTYVTVAIMKTDANGQAFTYVDLDDVWYKWILTKDGVVERDYSPAIIPDTSDDPEELTLYLEPTEYEFFHYISDISYNCTVNKTSEVIRCTVADTSGMMTTFCLKVDRMDSTGYVNECYSCDTSSGTTLTCSLSSTGNKTYRYELRSAFTDTEYIVYVGWVSFLGEMTAYGLTGVFLALLIIMTMSFVGLWSPAASIIGGTIGLVVSVMLNLVVISPGIVVGIIIASGIIAIKGRW